MTPEHLAELAMAKQLLENPSLASRLSDAIGNPLEKGVELLPARWSEVIRNAAHVSLHRVLDIALATLNGRPHNMSLDRMHKVLVATAGAAGGAFGMAALGVELPMSATLMLRSIADIARSEGELIHQVEARLSCLQVFAFGGPSDRDDAAETGYFAVRAALGRAVRDALRHIGEHGVASKSAPALLRLVAAIASRFGIAVSHKVAAQAVPIVGAAGGAIVNTLFIDHYQNMARGHFIVRRLERQYGCATVKQTYRDLTEPEFSTTYRNGQKRRRG